MSLRQHPDASSTSTNGADRSPLIEHLDELAARYGNRFLLEPAPDNQLPKHGMRSVDAMRLIGEELVLGRASAGSSRHRTLIASRRRACATRTCTRRRCAPRRARAS